MSFKDWIEAHRAFCENFASIERKTFMGSFVRTKLRWVILLTTRKKFQKHKKYDRFESDNATMTKVNFSN